MTIELMDTTLRDGEQTTGVSFNDSEKLTMARILLQELKVDRIEVASARVSAGEFKAVQKISEWAAKNNLLDRIEVLGFVDNGVSLNWIKDTGARVCNLLTKGSLKHVTSQLRKTPEEHIEDIRGVLKQAREMNIDINIYLEDWSNGMIDSPEYVFFLLDQLQDDSIKRFMLPDTLGVLNPDQVKEFCSAIITRYPNLHFDFHAHNDYDLAVANVFAAVKSGFKGIHTTINGLGERAGNAPMASVVGVLTDQLKAKTNIDESKLTRASQVVESFSGIRIPANKPLTGEYVFTQCAGIHADGDSKDNLYFNNLMPERFGRVRKYALGKTSGRANILKNLEELGISLSTEEMQRVTKEVIELGDKKETVTTEDLPYIISDVLKSSSINEYIKVNNYSLSLTRGMKPTASLSIKINDKDYQASSAGDGQYDAFMKALWKIYDELKKPHPLLADYYVTIPPGGKTDAFVETVISWEYNDKVFKTRGLDADQTEAAIKATVKMLNLIENENINL
ncbi:alpha-isopropylmalate synthase regulatory domain-containing protein [Carboxylicivirga caseinilyticus]|uniref:alpha-isopropylmalate synthase regulatory domain-containing protein n=1 Tax=Carboxylicivirga caseinilyticus TaxID=3417572 RepID=UPI003D349A68|nr:2-isopropylmalate synthase [Marinilabiliaceae bacterium A049]